jgi:RNA polymerase sigma-70 factor (ECF subfamily)
MGGRDTVIGGAQQSFPTTIWSQILAAGDPSDPQSRERLNQLILCYWKPVYAYIRASWHKSIEDAKDLTQAFFVRLLEKDYVSRLRPERGSFRGYLKQALKHFLNNADRDAAVRRPERPVFRLDATDEDLTQLGPGAPDESPDDAYDHEWFCSLVETCIEEFRQELTRQGKGIHFEVLKIYVLDPLDPHREADRPTYGNVASRLGIKETDVRNYLNYCRTALRQILRARIRNYVEGEADVDRELRGLLDG